MTTQTRESVSVLPSSAPPLVHDEALSSRVRVVFIDDDDQYRESVGADLAEHGFEVTDFAGGDAAIEFFAGGNTADIILLDWKLPKQSGPDVLRQLRRRGVLIPVVFLTGLAAESYEEVALDSGALDFVDKMRNTSILAKRLRLIAEAGKKPPELPEEEVKQVGNLRLKPKVCRAYWNDSDLGLTVTEFNIVHLLAERRGQDVTYRAIYDCVHHAGFIAGSGEDGYRTNVRSSVKRIRNKFKAIDAEFAEIENFAGFGYRWRDGDRSSG